MSSTSLVSDPHVFKNSSVEPKRRGAQDDKCAICQQGKKRLYPELSSWEIHLCPRKFCAECVHIPEEWVHDPNKRIDRDDRERYHFYSVVCWLCQKRGWDIVSPLLSAVNPEWQNYDAEFKERISKLKNEIYEKHDKDDLLLKGLGLPDDGSLISDCRILQTIVPQIFKPGVQPVVLLPWFNHSLSASGASKSTIFVRKVWSERIFDVKRAFEGACQWVIDEAPRQVQSLDYDSDCIEVCLESPQSEAEPSGEESTAEALAEELSTRKRLLYDGRYTPQDYSSALGQTGSLSESRSKDLPLLERSSTNAGHTFAVVELSDSDSVNFSFVEGDGVGEQNSETNQNEDSMQAVFESFISHIRMCDDRNKTVQAKLKELHDVLKDKEGKINRFADRARKDREKHAVLEEHVECFKYTLSQKDAEIRNLCEENMRSTDEIRRLQAQLEEAKQNQNPLQQACTQLEDRYASLKDEYTGLEVEHSSLKDNYSTIEEKCNSIKSKNACLEDEYISLQDRYSSLKSEYLSREDRYRTLDVKCRSLEGVNDRLEIACIEREKWTDIAMELRDKVSTWATKYQNFKDKASIYDRDQRRELNEANARIHELTQSVAGAEQAHTACSMTIKALGDEKRKLQDELQDTLRTTQASFQSERSQLMAQIESGRNNAEIAREMLAEEQLKMRALTTAQFSIETEHARLQGVYNDLLRDNADLGFELRQAIRPRTRNEFVVGRVSIDTISRLERNSLFASLFQSPNGSQGNVASDR